MHGFTHQDIDIDLGSESPYRCLMPGLDGDGEAAHGNFLSVLEDTPRSPKAYSGWLPCCRRTPMHARSIGGGGAHVARRAILTWRLQRPYLVYCLCCSTATLILLGWNLCKGMDNNWNLPQWKHHFWEEVLEVALGACMVLETFLTLGVLGMKTFFSNGWCRFDFVVMLATVVSISYGLEHIGRQGEITEADVPLLSLRFVLQPARVLAVCMSARRTHEMQQADELQVDFGALEASGPGMQATAQEMR